MTKKEFKKLKVGDKVKIKKYDPCANGDAKGNSWTYTMDKFIRNDKPYTISQICPSDNGDYFRILEDPYGYKFHYKSIKKVVVGTVDEVDEIINNKPKTLPDSVIYSEERIKQLEAEIKALKAKQKKYKDFETNKQTGSQINDVIEGLMAGGLSREEAFTLVSTTCAEFMKKTNFKLY